MERRTSLGVYYSNESLDIPEECYPLNFVFLEEGCERDGTRNDIPVVVVGYIKPCYKGAPDGQVLIVQHPYQGIESVDKSTVIYEHKPKEKKTTRSYPRSSIPF